MSRYERAGSDVGLAVDISGPWPVIHSADNQIEIGDDDLRWLALVAAPAAWFELQRRRAQEVAGDDGGGTPSPAQQDATEPPDGPTRADAIAEGDLIAYVCKHGPSCPDFSCDHAKCKTIREMRRALTTDRGESDDEPALFDAIPDDRADPHTVGCPSCKSLPGTACMTPTGMLAKPHAARKRLAAAP